MPLAFAKYHGLGNDFVVLDRRRVGLISPEHARRLCDRHRGIGADGVLSILEAREGADLRMHVYNADGSVAEMCGNGLRCVVHRIATLSGQASMVVDTDAGRRRGEVLPSGEVRVDLGPARVHSKPVDVILGDRRVEGVRVDVGNPHLVLPEFPPEAVLAALAGTLGPALSKHDEFEHGTNVEFPRVLSDMSIEVAVYERGVGLTEACGTGAGAVVAALMARGRVEDRALVRLPGGALWVDARGADLEITGEAVHVFDGLTYILH